MPSMTVIHESLPYIDPEPKPSERAAAESLIAAERFLVPDDPDHALLPNQISQSAILNKHLTPLLKSELLRLSQFSSTSSSSHPNRLAAIDLIRYSSNSDISSSSTSLPLPFSEQKASLSSFLSLSRVSTQYILARHAHLSLLDSPLGKNAWLLANWQAETVVLAPLEAELARTRTEIDTVTVRRQKAQEEVAAEMRSLEEAWRRGVGRVLETEAATEALRRETLGVRRRLSG